MSVRSATMDRDLMKLSMEHMQDCAPGRLGGVWAINQPTYMNVLWALVRPLMKRKMRSRIHLLRGSGVQEALDEVRLSCCGLRG